MNKIIATGALLTMTAMGMACGGSSTNANVNISANKPANNTNAVVIPVNTATPMSSPSNMSTTGNTTTTGNSSMKPSNSTMSPVSNANAKSTPATANKPANK